MIDKHKINKYWYRLKEIVGYIVNSFTHHQIVSIHKKNNILTNSSKWKTCQYKFRLNKYGVLEIAGLWIAEEEEEVLLKHENNV